MAASTSTAVPSAVLEDVSRLRAVVDHSTKEVKDYTTQYEDQYKLVEVLGTDRSKSENKSVLDILTLREGRLDASLVKEADAIAILANFYTGNKAPIQAQAIATAAAFGVAPIPATPTVTYHVTLVVHVCATPHLTKWIFGVCLGGPAKRVGPRRENNNYNLGIDFLGLL